MLVHLISVYIIAAYNWQPEQKPVGKQRTEHRVITQLKQPKQSQGKQKQLCKSGN